MNNNYPYNFNNYKWPNNNGFQKQQNVYYQDDRNLLVPFLFGGVAGTALGYGIANNKILLGIPFYVNLQKDCDGPGTKTGSGGSKWYDVMLNDYILL